MPKRLGIDYDRAREHLDIKKISGVVTDLMCRVPRSVRDDLADKSMRVKPTLVDGPVTSLAKACMAGDPMNFFNPAQIICSESLNEMQLGVFPEVALVRVPGDSGKESIRGVGFPLEVDEIKRVKSDRDRYARLHAIKNISKTDTDTQFLALYEFLNTVSEKLFQSSYTWIAESTELIAKHQDELRTVEKLLASDVSPDRSGSVLMGSLDDVIYQSTEHEELVRNVKHDLVYDDYQVFYVPLYDEFDIEFVWLDQEHLGPNEVACLEKRLFLDCKIPKIHHLLIVTPPGKQMALVDCDLGGKRTVHLNSDWEPGGPFLNIGKNNWVRCTEAHDLFEAYKDRVRIREWVE